MARVILIVVTAVALMASGACDVAAGQPTHATASTTPSPVMLAMPDVVGESAAVARDQLTRLGFRHIEFGTVDGHKLIILPQNWTVTTQSARKGDKLPADALIVLGCTRNG